MEPACQPEHLSPGTSSLPSCYQQDCQPVWGSCSLWVTGILVREFNPPCVVCSGRSFHFKLWFLRTSQLHNWELLGLLLFNVRVEIKEIVGFLVLFCFQNISLVALRVGFFGFKIESGKVKIK